MKLYYCYTDEIFYTEQEIIEKIKEFASSNIHYRNFILKDDQEILEYVDEFDIEVIDVIDDNNSLLNDSIEESYVSGGNDEYTRS